jgi:hypothetical protein
MSQSRSDAARSAIRWSMVLGRGVESYVSVGTVAMAGDPFEISWTSFAFRWWFHPGYRGRTIWAEFLRDGEALQAFGSSFGKI